MEKFCINAYAKINLTLDVLGKRSDGYHEISSVMQNIRLHDQLSVEKTDKAGVFLESDCPGLPCGEGNLIYRAAVHMLKKYKLRGVSVRLKKNIPIAAGLGGGSSDCAAALIAINSLFELNLPQRELLETALSFGADVPFCLTGGTCLAEGIGERLTALNPHPKITIVLAAMPFPVSTRDIFSNLAINRRGHTTPAMLEAIANGSLAEIAACLSNGLTETAVGCHKLIKLVMDAFKGEGAIAVNMTGSGPSVYAYFSSESEGRRAVLSLQKQFPECRFYCSETHNE